MQRSPATPLAARIRLGLIVLSVPVMTLALYLGGDRGFSPAAIAVAQAGVFWLALRLRPPDPISESGRHRPPLPLARPAVEAMLARAAQAPRSGPVSAALAIRIDSADRILAEHGAAVMALLMQELGERLAVVLREQDSYCHLDTSGFGVALFPQRGLDLGSVLAVAQRIQARLAERATCGTVTLWPTVSVGFSLSPRAATLNGLSMLDAADLAAAKALRNGPAGLNSYSVVDFPAMLTGERVDTLIKALETGEITAFFQPQIRTDTGQISGFEALARWRHPQRGLISPAEFLPMIEAAGLSPKLAQRMLRDALGTLTTLQAQGLAVPSVSINLSAAELRDPQLADEIAWELDRHDLQPERLVLEILETVVTDSDDDLAVRNIARLAKMGCGIDLDDFGTGHASIASIRRFAVARLKIDRSFVTRMHLDEDQQRMVSAILSMADRLGLQTLAEGVECAEEQVMLAQMGCQHLQGFAIARPMPPADLPGWITAHQAALALGEPWCNDVATRDTAESA